jgi:hypothetical protein
MFYTKNAENRVKWNDLDDGTLENTTIAKQPALFVVLYSPLQMLQTLLRKSNYF